MRGRLLRSTLLIALVAVVTLGVPLVLLARHQVWTAARDTLRQQAASVAAGLEDRLDADRPVDLARYADLVRGHRIVVVTADGASLSTGPVLPGAVLHASVRVSGDSVTVQAPRGPTVRRAREATLLVGGLALLAVAASVGLALWQARRLAAPLAALAARADALGRGNFSSPPVVSGIGEIDGISRVLDRSAQQLGSMIELQRQFASDAAHQLRTPLTGIGLRLDELTRIGDEAVHQEAEDALAQVERLDRVITALLDRARGDAADPTRIDLAQLIDQEAQGWTKAFAAHSRALTLDVQPELFVLVRREHVAGVLSCLLDNALQHGADRVHLSSHSAGMHVQVEVTDEGPGVPDQLAAHVFDRRVSGSHGTGIGLALARSLAAAEGGQLDLVPGSGGRFRLTLPLDPRP